MRAIVVTPAAPGSLSGNRVTAQRWAQRLAELGHEVRVLNTWHDEPADLLVALHARKSHDSVVRWSERCPDAPLVVGLAGTDVYGDLDDETLDSLQRAHRLVALQRLAAGRLPAALQGRVHVVHQSAEAPPDASSPGAGSPASDTFDACVLAHLRPVKDPLLAARAVRRLPDASRVRVRHAGQALDDTLAAEARREERANPRYLWHGLLPRAEAQRLLASSRLLVLSSRAEGGANALSEAIVCGVPVLSTRIDGSVGLLGDAYPGLFPVGDEAALAALLGRAEADAAFLAELRRSLDAIAPRFTPEAEREAWRDLLRAL